MPEIDLIQRMAEAPVVFDGAMGTMLYEKGVFLNRCYDELCLTMPQLVAEIHRQYCQAGADVIETNTFGANPIRLRSHGLADNTAAINRAGARIAREQAGDNVYVAGSVGPCLTTGQRWNPDNTDEIAAAFLLQITALAEGGVDCLLLETFTHLEELKLAADLARETGLPVLASFTVDARGETAHGMTVETMVRRLDAHRSVDAIGLNCGAGPAPLFDALEIVVPLTAKPVVVMPNAGMPRQVEGRMLFLTNPEYFTEYAKRYIALGVRGVGGCCGTTPDHIRVMAKAVRTLSGVKRHIEVRDRREERPEAAQEVIPAAQRSRFASRLLGGHRVSSVELLPPRSSNLSALIEKARHCHFAGVDAINIPDGPRASARISPMIAALALQREVGIEAILHYCCRDRNLIGMQSDLLGGYAAGLHNFLIITGDPPKLGDYPDATGVFDVDAIGLTQVASNLNHGLDIGGSTIKPPTGIFIGVGANPCAVAMDLELSRYRDKVRAGAEFAITQPVFDPEALFRFLDAADAMGANIPVLAGVWPLVSHKNAEFMRNEVPGIEVPDAVVDRMAQCGSREEGLKVGIEIARGTCERIADRVAGFQVSAPFGKVDAALAVLAD